MSTLKRAKTLDDEQFTRLLTHIDTFSRMPARDRLMMMLSFKSGLRAAEIAGIDLNALTDAEGRIGKAVVVSGKIAKNGREREIPMNPQVRDAISQFRRAHPDARHVAISSQNGRDKMSPNTVAQYIRRLFLSAGFEDCSSHSGRRTFGTTLSRRANKFGRSLRDVQKLMGHARLDTTERYIDVAEESFDLVASL